VVTVHLLCRARLRPIRRRAGDCLLRRVLGKVAVRLGDKLDVGMAEQPRDLEQGGTSAQ
jgi:hypothetical protein